MKPVTNITDEHKAWLDFIRESRPADRTVALMSCFVNGQPTAALCTVQFVAGEVEIRPMFVAVTDGMVITDHDGAAAGPLEVPK